MKAGENITLPRLLERREMTSLLQALAAPDIRLALIRIDGDIFAITDNWAPADRTGLADLSGLMNASNGSQTIHANGYRVYPLLAGTNLVGALVGHGPSPRGDFPLEHALHQTLQTLIAQSQGKREMASEALERYREINLMYRVSETIGVSLDPDAIPQMVLEEGNHVIHADAGLVLLSQAGVNSEIKSSFGAPEHAAALADVARFVSEMPALVDRPAILTELPTDAPPFGAVLWAPLKTKEQALGGVLLGRLQGQEVFTASDEKLLMSLARQAAVAVENSRLHQAVLERERLKRELQLAHDVQASLIPREVPQIAGWDFAAHWQPAREVGGDYYDFIERDDGQLGLAIADVSDKGMHAALFMALTRSTLRASTLAAPKPAQGLIRANRLLCADSTGGMFVTLFYSQLDPAAHKMVYVNAGHNPPLLYRAAKKNLVELTRTGIMVGFDDTYRYQQRSVQLQRGDFVLFYTDGVTESINAQEEQFGEERLQRVLLDHCTESPAEILRALKQALGDFTGDIPPFDDVTIVVVKRLAGR